MLALVSLPPSIPNGVLGLLIDKTSRPAIHRCRQATQRQAVRREPLDRDFRAVQRH
ncbi:MAG: hypothetical protein RLZ98_3126 [Pseudomonadota bacterium]|jgi:hypothetical protein